MFVSWFRVGKMTFHHCWLTPEKCVWPPHGQIHYFPPAWKKLSGDHGPLCVDQGLSNLLHISNYPSNALFLHNSCMLMYTNVQIRQCL